MSRILITGAAGNLGSLLARRLLTTKQQLRLMVHRRPLADDLAEAPSVEVVTADLDLPETLGPACAEVGTIVHFAGVLFRPWPERFLPRTNLQFFQNLVDAALTAGVGKIILISFPHVEGQTTPDDPARGRLDRKPTSVHAQTRLEEERYLLARCDGTATTPVVLRVGMVYGPGVLMIETARWLLQRRLLAVWPRPTGIHLIAKEDFLTATEAAIFTDAAAGIYHLGDDQPLTLQEFLDRLADRLGYPRPWRLPWAVIYLVSLAVEIFATVFRTQAPLTRDFIRIGSSSYCGDNSRMKQELLPDLSYPTIAEGLLQFGEA
ncbi:MAG: NAD-dependent epimerase/dehydratase family protein [Bacteroidota bacterium]